MDYLEEKSRGYLIQTLHKKGFSSGEAESRVAGIETKEVLQKLLTYIESHPEASIGEIRFVHTGLIREYESKLIGSSAGRVRLSDEEYDRKRLLIRTAHIDWYRDGLDLYLSQIASLRGLETLEFKKPVTFFVGENGSGKSTLLEAMAVSAGFNPEGGTRNYLFSTSDTHSALCNAVSFTRSRKPDWGLFLRAETFYNMATEAENIDEEFAEDVKLSGMQFTSMFGRYEEGKSFHRQSHGESFYSVLKGDIKENGLYFLDEPEAALSPRRQLNLLGLISRFSKRGAQFIIATHSPILLACPDACIYEFSGAGVREITYEETDIYRIVSSLVNDKDKILRDVIIDGKQY